MHFIGYINVDWEVDVDERKSILGYMFLLDHDATSWSSKKQTCKTLSTMEVEFITYILRCSIRSNLVEETFRGYGNHY